MQKHKFFALATLNRYKKLGAKFIQGALIGKDDKFNLRETFIPGRMVEYGVYCDGIALYVEGGQI
mgnify:FL=1